MLASPAISCQTLMLPILYYPIVFAFWREKGKRELAIMCVNKQEHRVDSTGNVMFKLSKKLLTVPH